MFTAAWVLAWLFSLAPLLLERAGNLDLCSLGAESAPRTALCALPWIALAGLPRPAAGKFCAALWCSGCMACLPVLVLGFALDLESGASSERGVRSLLIAFVLIGLSALAAELAKARTKAHRVHAALWILGCVGVPLLAAILRFGPRLDGSAPAWLEALAGASPLDWAWAAVDGAPSPWAAVLAMLLLCALCAALAREPAG